MKAWILRLTPALLVFGTGCAAGQYCDAARDVHTRNPHAAIDYLALCLEEDPAYQEAHNLLSEVILKAIASNHENKVAAMTRAGSWEEAVADCDRVVASAALAYSLPGQYQIYHDDHRSQFAGEAAKKYYQLGVDYQAQNRWKDAARAYRRTLGFRVNFQDAKSRYDACAGQAKVFMTVNCEGPREDRQAIDILESGVPRATKERGLEFLEFVGRGRATAMCTIRVDGNFYDSGWQADQGSNTVWVNKVDPNTGQYVKDPKTGKILQEQRSATWVVYSRSTSYDGTFSFNVKSRRAGDPEPSGSTSKSSGDAQSYATWSGQKEAVPNRVLNLPNSPVEPRDRGNLSRACAQAAVDDLGHQLFLAYEK